MPRVRLSFQTMTTGGKTSFPCIGRGMGETSQEIIERNDYGAKSPV